MACWQVLFPFVARERAVGVAHAAPADVELPSTILLTEKKRSCPSSCDDNITIRSEIDSTALDENLGEGVSEAARQPGAAVATERGAHPPQHTQDLPGSAATSRKPPARKQRWKRGATLRPRRRVASLCRGSRAEGLCPVGCARRATTAHRSRGV